MYVSKLHVLFFRALLCKIRWRQWISLRGFYRMSAFPTHSRICAGRIIFVFSLVVCFFTTCLSPHTFLYMMEKPPSSHNFNDTTLSMYIDSRFISWAHFAVANLFDFLTLSVACVRSSNFLYVLLIFSPRLILFLLIIVIVSDFPRIVWTLLSGICRTCWCVCMCDAFFVLVSTHETIWVHPKVCQWHVVFLIWLFCFLTEISHAHILRASPQSLLHFAKLCSKWHRYRKAADFQAPEFVNCPFFYVCTIPQPCK